MRLRLRFVVAEFEGKIPVEQSQVIYFVPPSCERIADVSREVSARWALPSVQLYFCVAGAAEYLLPFAETILVLNDLDEVVVRRRCAEAAATPADAHDIPAAATAAVEMPSAHAPVETPSAHAPDRKRKQGMFEGFVSLVCVTAHDDIAFLPASL